MIHILIGFFLYCIYQCCMFTENVRNTSWMYVIAITYAVTAHILWTHLIQILDNKDEIFRYGWYWDVSLYIPIIAVPLILFSVKPTLLQSVGITIILVGVVLFHLGR